MRKKRFLGILLSLSLLFIVSCSDNTIEPSVNNNDIEYGNAMVKISTQDLKVLAKAKEMSYAYVIIQIYTSDSLIIDTIESSNNLEKNYSIPEGQNILFEVNAFSTDSILYKTGSASEDVLAGDTVEINIDLKSLYGSLFINFAKIPDNVDSVIAFVYSSDMDSIHFSFSLIEEDGEYNDSAYANIDYVPLGELRNVSVFFLSSTADTLYTANASLNVTDENVFGVWYIDINQYAKAIAKVSINLGDNGAGYIYGSFVDDIETGEIIITEIRYKGSVSSDTDYVELHNISSEIISMDSLELFYGTTNVGLPSGLLLYPDSFLVVSNGILTYSDAVATNSLKLPATNKLIQLKKSSGELIDKVWYYTSGEWPNDKVYTSIQLLPISYNCKKNNYGVSWINSVDTIIGTGDLGSPGY